MESGNSLASGWWRFLEDYVYHIPDAPPRKRTVPLEIICVGLPRSGTESLQAALLRLGYDHTYHGWDVVAENPPRYRNWARLTRRKFMGDDRGEHSELTRDDFDSLLGHCRAVTDLPASLFALELIDAYPEAKVIINYREDRDAWLSSIDDTILKLHQSKLGWFLHWWDPKIFWLQNLFSRYMVPGQLRYLDSREGSRRAGRARGKWVYREHCAMVRGTVPAEKLLEWKVQDGWEPLCKFLGKEVPEGKFPHVNTKSGGWKKREEEWTKELTIPLVKKVILRMLAVLIMFAGIGWALWTTPA